MIATLRDRLPRTPRQWARALILETLAVGVPAAAVLLAPPGPFELSHTTGLIACLALPLRLLWSPLGMVSCVVALPFGLGFPATLVAMYRIGRRAAHMWAPGLWVLVAVVVAVLPVVVTQGLPWNRSILTVLFVVVEAGGPVALGGLITVRRELTECLAEARRARDAEGQALGDSARAEERARIAREIHDAVGHHATLIAVESAALAATTEEPTTRETAHRLRALAKESLAEMRAALGLLRGPLQPAQGLSDLAELVSRARLAGVPVGVDDTVGPGADLPPAVGRAAFRVVQEGLTNVSKHAPGASVRIRLAQRDNTLRVTVVNGPCPDAPVPRGDRDGAGLQGLSERVTMAGGTLLVDRRPDGGFSIEAVLPTRPTVLTEQAGPFGGHTKVECDHSTIDGTRSDSTPA